MKNTHDTLPPEQTIAGLAHFAWCALLSLRTSQQDSQALSLLTIHTFLLRWLAMAQKQKRFPRTIASDIERLLALGCNKGAATGLPEHLETLWVFCTGSVAMPADIRY